jgi:hypothetical protein
LHLTIARGAIEENLMRVHNIYYIGGAVAALGAAVAGGPCLAAGSSGQQSNAPSGSMIPSSGDAVKAGDIIFFRSDADIFTRNEKTFCAPPKSRFIVTSITPGTKAPAAQPVGSPDSTSGSGGGDDGTSSKNTGATAANTQIVTGVFPSKRGGLHHPQDPEQLQAQAKEAPAKSTVAKETAVAAGSEGTPSPGGDKSTCADNLITTDVAYHFTTDDLDGVYTQRMGFTYGAMVIPYKFYFTDKSFKSNPSTVAFAGYEGYIPGLSLAGVVTLGPGLGSTTQSSGNNSSTSGGNPSNQSTGSSATAVTYTAALGVIATFNGGPVKAGLLFGRDWQGSGSGFKYENKTWMALSVGTNF